MNLQVSVEHRALEEPSPSAAKSLLMSTYLSCIIDSKKDGRKCGETIAKSCLLGKKSHIFFMDVDAI